jgi:hypothetical protein
LTSGSGVGDGRETAEEGEAAAGGLVADEFGSGLTNSAEVEAIPLECFGWSEVAAFTSVGGGAASAFSFCGFGRDDATAFTKFGAGGPTISDGSGETDAIGLTNLGAGIGAAFKRSWEGEATTFISFGEGRGVTGAGENEAGNAFGKIPCVGLGFPVGAFKPLVGAEPV